jgi:beta-galactosidase
MSKLSDRVFYGGDYNPDQWDEDTIEQDMVYFKKAGINLVTLPVFSWAKLEPDEGVYDFEWLDQLMDKFAKNKISVCLATPTCAQPAWLSTRYPEVLPVDIAGRKRTHGMRVFFCYNSLKYRERAAAIAEEMAKRYKNHPALAIWHVANEYGTYCYCPTCQAKFRLWLKKRYKTVKNLNLKWHTSFWGRVVTDFEEVTLPTELNDDYRFNPAIQLDYQRFVTDSTVECFLNERDVIKKYTPDIPVQTNISGFIKKLDQFELVKHMDFLGWDNYPAPDHDKSFVALKLDIMRGLKEGKPFILAEQSPNQQNWQPYNKLKRPGEVRLLSYQAMAHGADTCLFFQLRQSVGGQEKFHGAVISHGGHDNTRVFRESAKLGQELKQMGDAFIGGRIKAEVGILFDWSNWWALELSSGPSKDMDYLGTVAKYYKPFYENNIPVDILHFDRDISGYKIIVGPMLYMIKEGIAEKIQEFVKKGGTYVATTMTGIADENDRCIFGEYPGPLKEVLGLWVEETDALSPTETNSVVITEHSFWKNNVKIKDDFNTSHTGNMASMVDNKDKKIYSCNFLCDVIHEETAEVLGVYGGDFYKGIPCMTRNSYGKGVAYYIGTQPEEELLKGVVGIILKERDIKPLFKASVNVEITCRVTEDREVVFVINHNNEIATVDLGEDKFYDYITKETLTGVTEIGASDVLVLKK